MVDPSSSFLFQPVLDTWGIKSGGKPFIFICLRTTGKEEEEERGDYLSEPILYRK